MENATEKQECWSLYGWEGDGWVQLNETYYEEDDAYRALARAEDNADKNALQHFIVVADHDKDFVFPNDPTKGE